MIKKTRQTTIEKKQLKRKQVCSQWVGSMIHLNFQAVLLGFIMRLFDHDLLDHYVNIWYSGIWVLADILSNYSIWISNNDKKEKKSWLYGNVHIKFA